MDRDEIEANLSGSEFFSGLDKDAIGKIVALCNVETFDSWKYLFRQGEPGENLYVVVSGKVLLERTINLGSKKGSVVIDTLGKGRVCGCWSTLLDAPHTLMSSATCQEPTTVLTISGAALRSVMTKETTFGFQVLERLSFLLRDRIQSVYGAMEKI